MWKLCGINIPNLVSVPYRVSRSLYNCKKVWWEVQNCKDDWIYLNKDNDADGAKAVLSGDLATREAPVAVKREELHSISLTLLTEDGMKVRCRVLLGGDVVVAGGTYWDRKQTNHTDLLLVGLVCALVHATCNEKLWRCIVVCLL